MTFFMYVYIMYVIYAIFAYMCYYLIMKKMKNYKMTKKYANFNYLIVSCETLKNKIIKKSCVMLFYYCFQNTKTSKLNNNIYHYLFLCNFTIDFSIF